MSLAGFIGSSPDMKFCRPRVSVVIPTYNRAQFISSAIESVLRQSFDDFELIVVDDGSIDRTSEIVTSTRDPRLIAIRQDNAGRSNARNRALAMARGELIAFLDSDDLYLPGKLALQVKYMDEHPEAGMIYTSARCIDGLGNDLPGRYEAKRSGRIYADIAFFRPVTITLPTVMVRKTILEQVGGFDECMSRFEDTDMWRRVSKVTDIHAIDVDTCKLRTHLDNGLSSQNPDQIVSSVEYYSSKILQQDTDVSFLRIQQGLGGLHYYYGRALMTVAGWEAQSWKLFMSALRYWPFYGPLVVAAYIRHLLLCAGRAR